jgi:hypothetical protein
MAGDGATRLRLVELRSTDGPVRAIRFTGRCTLVTGFGPPERLASWIATALTGPRPDGVEGLVEVAGRAVELRDLPAMLLPPQASIVVTDADIEEARRRAVTPRYERVAARKEAVAAQRYREEAARAASATRFAALERRLADLEPSLAETMERAAFDARRAETMRVLRGRLDLFEQAAVAAQRPDPDALEIADDWDALRDQRDELIGIGPTMPLDEARRWVTAAHAALDQARHRRATLDDVARLHELQAATVQATQQSNVTHIGGDASEGGEPDAPDAAAQAREAERASLQEMGHTHVSLLLDMVSPRSADDEIATAETMLANAQRELERSERVAALPAPDEVALRELELRGRAATVLGRFPGNDVPGELRGFRPAEPAFQLARAALRDASIAAGLMSVDDTTDDVDVPARDWLTEQDRNPPIDHTSRVTTLTVARDTVERELRAEAAELVAIAARLRDLDRSLTDLAAQEARVASELAAGLEALNPVEIEDALRDVLSEFTASKRFPGRLPIVMGGVSSVFEAERCEGTLRMLEGVSDELQVIIVADRPAVEAWVQRLGADASVWSPHVAAAVEAEERAAREEAERARREAEQRAVREAEERARREADDKARREAQLVADYEAEERARREAEERARRDAEELARGGVHIASGERLMVDLSNAEARDVRLPGTSVPEGEVDLGDDHEHEDAHGQAQEGEHAHDDHESGAEVQGAGDDVTSLDDWWVPIVPRPGGSRAARPVGENLEQRRRRAERIAGEAERQQRNPEILDVKTYCDVHRGIETALHCARCHLPFCDQCLALLGEPPALHCVDCALELSGVPAHRIVRRA